MQKRNEIKNFIELATSFWGINISFVSEKAVIISLLKYNEDSIYFLIQGNVI